MKSRGLRRQQCHKTPICLPFVSCRTYNCNEHRLYNLMHRFFRRKGTDDDGGGGKIFPHHLQSGRPRIRATPNTKHIPLSMQGLYLVTERGFREVEIYVQISWRPSRLVGSSDFINIRIKNRKTGLNWIMLAVWACYCLEIKRKSARVSNKHYRNVIYTWM